MSGTVIDPAELQACSEFLAARIGLHFPPARWPDLQRGLQRAAPAFGFSDAASCLRWLLGAPLGRRQVEILASQLSVGETYFFREPAVFTALESQILPPLIAARRASGRRLRLWSAGCCTGEEPYSLAILLSRLIPDLAEWQISILGTDINPDFLAKAQHGCYRDWSFRAAPPSLKNDCFSAAEAGSHQLAPRFRRLVHFDYLNLAEDTYPSVDNNTNGMDLILCRNVLMYFEAGVAAAVAGKLHRALVDGGWLIVSPTETSAQLFGQFVPISFPAAIVYRKSGAGAPTRPATALRTETPWGETPWIAASGLPATLGAPYAVPCSAPAPVQPPIAVPETAAPGIALPDAPPPRPSPYETALAAYAEGAYERVLTLLSEDAGADRRAPMLLARACANLGRLDEAGRWCETAVAGDKCNPGLRYLLATVLDERGQSAAAATALKQALYLDQDFVLAHFALGNLYRRLDNPVLARKHLAAARHLLRRQPADAALPDAEGLTAGRLGEIIDATEGLS